MLHLVSIAEKAISAAYAGVELMHLSVALNFFQATKSLLHSEYQGAEGIIGRAIANDGGFQ